MRSCSEHFENKDCEYYPCHDLDEINCLFCYCPLYHIEHCPGDPKYDRNTGKRDCSRCDFPHKCGNYRQMIEILEAPIV